MALGRVETESFLQVDHAFYTQQITKVIDHILPKYLKKVKFYLFFHSFFGALLLLECLVTLVFFPKMVGEFTFSLLLALFLMTLFSWGALYAYLLPQKELWANETLERYTKSIKNLIGYDEKIAEHHFILANGFCKFSAHLQGKEAFVYKAPRIFSFLDPFFRSLSSFAHKADLFVLREALLKSSIKEHIKLVQKDPTNLEIHTALANAYLLLSGLYESALKHYEDKEELSSSALRKKNELEKKFRRSAEKVIEEFKIMNDYNPNDPLVHEQLAFSYHDLKMPKEEIREYEILLQLRPKDCDVMLKLGTLYFQQEKIAKGLRMYEELKSVHPKKADALLENYGKSDEI